jgi:7-carboxy-7-deazaguanine synthase
MGDGSELLVHSIFATIQGEGPFAGAPAIFLRLAGCNLQCPLCDTEYTQGAYLAPVYDVVKSVLGAAIVGDGRSSIGLVVITGGEPFRQNLGKLVHMLIASGMQVQVESNGHLPARGISETLFGDPSFMVVVSPKTAILDADLAERAAAFKYVVRDGDVDPDDLLPVHALDHPIGRAPHIARPPRHFNGVIYVQPADEQDEQANRRNLAAAAASVLAFPSRRRLGVQIHKLAGLA